MILCVNLNAAIDKTIVVDSFRLGSIHRPQTVRSLAGGKGCNVARALLTFGQKPVVTGWVGGTAGQFIENQLQQEGIATDFIYTDFESRTCTSILDSSNQHMTEIYENGPPVENSQVNEMRSHFEDIVASYSAVTLSGSLPPGVPDDFYGQLIMIAHQAEVPVFLDSSREALRRGVDAKPFLVKPNESEIAMLTNQDLENLEQFAAAALHISNKYKTMVVLSLGRQGAIVAHEDEEVLQVMAPPVAAKSAVGSGDCLLAGVVHGFIKGFERIEWVKLGVAAGTANTLTIGAGQFSRKDLHKILPSVVASELLT